MFSSSTGLTESFLFTFMNFYIPFYITFYNKNKIIANLVELYKQLDNKLNRLNSSLLYVCFSCNLTQIILICLF